MHYGLKHNFAWVLINKGGGLVIGFLAAIIINRAIGPDGRGALAEMQTWITLFSVVAGWSLETAVYHCANREQYQASNSDKLATTVMLSLASGMLAGISMLFFIYFWPDQVSLSAREYMVIMCCLLLLTMLTSNVTVFAQSIGASKVAATGGIAQGVIYLLLSIGGYVADKLELKFILLAGCFTQFIGLCNVLSSLCRHFGRGAEYRFHMQTAKAMIRAGTKQHLATISTFLYTKINLLILFRYAGQTEAGLYAAAANLAALTQIIFGSFQSALYTRVIHGGDDYEISIRAMRVMIYGGGIIVGAMVIMAKPLLILYGGQEFARAEDLLKLLALAYWIVSISSLAAPLCIKAGAFWLSSTSAVILGICSMALNFMLIPRIGSMGAAVSTLVTMLIGFILIVGYLRFHTNKNPLLMFRPDFRPEQALVRALVKNKWRT